MKNTEIFIKTADYETAKSFLEERISRNESVIYIAEADQKVVGFTQLYPLFSSTRMKKLWLLNDLYVEEEYRQKGISVALIDRAKSYAEKPELVSSLWKLLKQIWLETIYTLKQIFN